jgi:hypothetical protein
MKTITCAHCGEQVTKRQSLFLEDHKGRVCRSHTEIFQEIEDKKQAEIDAKQKAEFDRQMKEHAEAVEKFISKVVESIRVDSYKNDLAIDLVMESRIAEFAGADAYVCKALETVRERIAELGPFSDEEKKKYDDAEKVQMMMHKMNIRSRMRVFAFQSGTTITAIYDSYVEQTKQTDISEEDKEYNLNILKECHEEALKEGEMTPEDAAEALMAFGALKQRVNG